jgi:DNA-binding IclR family transcriptional regulator
MNFWSFLAMPAIKSKPLAVRRRVRRPLAIEPVSEHRTGDTQHVNAVARALRILEAFRPGEGPLGNAELAERTGLTKPTVSRLAYTLVQAGYLSLNTERLEYELGGAALALGAVAFSYRNLRNVARPLMRAFAAKGAFNIGLGTRDRHLMIYTDACEGKGLVALRLYAGSRMPILTSAMGRAYLAGSLPEEREAILQELRPQYGAEWPAVLKGVQTALRDVANRGFCLSVGDWQKDIHGLAAPIRSATDGRVFAINLGGPAYLLPVAEMTDVLGPRLVRVAKEIESSLTRTR